MYIYSCQPAKCFQTHTQGNLKGSLRYFTELSRVKSFHINLCIGPIASVAQMFSDGKVSSSDLEAERGPCGQGSLLCPAYAYLHVAGYAFLSCLCSTQHSRSAIIRFFRVKDKKKHAWYSLTLSDANGSCRWSHPTEQLESGHLQHCPILQSFG